MPSLIPLTQGKFAVVDDDDYAWLSQWSWTAVKPRKSRSWYAHMQDGRRTRALHRVIMGDPAGAEVDHVNGDGLDNRRENLRVVTHQQNTRNTRLRRTSRSGYKGVSKAKHVDAYRARIFLDGKEVWLGYFKSAVEAARAYDEAARRLFGKYASLNFPRKGEVGAHRTGANEDKPPDEVKNRNNTSGYRGVTYKQKRWCARIGVGRSRRHLGYFADAESAARAYDTAAKQLFGAKAKLNFPEDVCHH